MLRTVRACQVRTEPNCINFEAVAAGLTSSQHLATFCYKYKKSS